MADRIDRAGLGVAASLADFIEQQVLPGTGIDAEAFWQGTAALFARFAPENAALLAKRDDLQARIDAWHQARAGQPIDGAGLSGLPARDRLSRRPSPRPSPSPPSDVDDEVARLAGPQLVVPVLNARFLLNAANARWGSLYDALYGTDALGSLPPRRAAMMRRAAPQVIARAKAFLDEAVPLAEGRWADFAGGEPVLADPAQLVGRAGDNLLFRHNGLHIELVIDRSHPIGRDDPAGIADVLLESALTTICDLEDSIAAVDAEDKVAAYANWLGLMKGDLEAQLRQGRQDADPRAGARSPLHRARRHRSLTLPGRACCSCAMSAT